MIHIVTLKLPLVQRFFANDFDRPLRQFSHAGTLTRDEIVVPDRHLCKRMATEDDPDYLQKRQC